MVIGAIVFVRNFYIHFLMNLVESKSYLAFKFFSCCLCKLRPFMRSNMNRNVYHTGRRVIPIGINGDLLKVEEINAEGKDAKLVQPIPDDSAVDESRNPLEDMI